MGKYKHWSSEELSEFTKLLESGNKVKNIFHLFPDRSMKALNSKAYVLGFTQEQEDNLKDKVFGELYVIRETNSRKLNNGYRDRYWYCKCSCGVEKEIRHQNLKNGQTKSCGHLLKEYVKSQPKREDSPSWKGGRRVDDGYVFIYMPQHPRAKRNGYIREHTVVMEKKIGRYLLPNENVHHKDGNKINNNPNNLELWVKKQPPGQRVTDLVKWAKEIIELYG